MQVRGIWDALKAVGTGYLEDRVPRLGAALAFYTILSSAPLLVIALAIAGLAFGREAVQGELEKQISALVGTEGGEAIQTMIAYAAAQESGVAGAVTGVVMLLIGASGVFAELQDGLDTVWGVTSRPGRGLWLTIRARFLSFVMVLGTGFVLLVTLVVSTALAALSRAARVPEEGVAGHALSAGLSFVVITLLFAMIFKVLPDVRISWRDVWVGAAMTSLLFTLGKLLISLYLGHAGLGSAYGAAGSLVVFVVWVYYSAQILYIGAEFTKVYACRYGSRIEPSDDAMPVTAEARARQGLSRHQTAGGATT